MSISNFKLKIISYIFIFSFIIAIIPLNLFYSFIFGLIFYELINYINKLFEKSLFKKYSKILTVIIVYLIILIIIFSLIIIIKNILIKNIYKIYFIIENIDNIFLKIINNIPNYIYNIIKKNIENFKNEITVLIKLNFLYIKNLSKYFIYELFKILTGLIIATLIFFNKKSYTRTYLISELIKRINTFSKLLKYVILGQLNVSLIKILLIYITIILLKIFNVNVPFYKTIIFLTFILGFLPIIGNFISNLIIIYFLILRYFTNIIVILLFLILIYNIEFILNIKIISNKIKSNSWEILLAMLIFQSVFGVKGLIAAPIYYSYIKHELKLNNLI